MLCGYRSSSLVDIASSFSFNTSSPVQRSSSLRIGRSKILLKKRSHTTDSFNVETLQFNIELEKSSQNSMSVDLQIEDQGMSLILN